MNTCRRRERERDTIHTRRRDVIDVRARSVSLGLPVVRATYTYIPTTLGWSARAAESRDRIVVRRACASVDDSVLWCDVRVLVVLAVVAAVVVVFAVVAAAAVAFVRSSKSDLRPFSLPPNLRRLARSPSCDTR